MDKEDCDWYEPNNKSEKNICKYFKGNLNKDTHIEKCRYHCTMMESKRMMESNRYINIKNIK